MKSKKIFRLLGSLTKDELYDFTKFLIYKFENDDNQSLKLVEFLSEFHPDFIDEQLNSKSIYEHMYPGEIYDDKKLRDRFSILVHVLEEYLFFKEVSSSKAFRFLFLIRQLRRRNLNEELIREFNSGYKFFECQQMRDQWHYLLKYAFYSEFSEFLDEHFEFRQGARESERFANYSDNLVYFFMISMLKNYVNLFIKGKVIKFNYSFKFIDLILSYLETEKDSLEQVPLLKMYHDFFTILKLHSGGEKFYTIKTLIISYKEKIPRESFKELYIALLYYSDALYKKGQKEYGLECFKLMNEMLRQGILFEPDGSVQEINYTSYVAVALRQKKLKAAEKFVNTYKNRLTNDVRDDSYNYNMAVIYYRKASLKNMTGAMRKNTYKEALTYLSNVRENHYYFYVRNNELAIKLNYEIGNLTGVLELIHSYRNNLYNDSFLPLEKKQGYLNFINYTEKLLNIRQYRSRTKLEYLKERINGCEKLIYKSWLLAKAEEVKIKKSKK